MRAFQVITQRIKVSCVQILLFAIIFVGTTIFFAIPEGVCGGVCGGGMRPCTHHEFRTIGRAADLVKWDMFAVPQFIFTNYFSGYVTFYSLFWLNGDGNGIMRVVIDVIDTKHFWQTAKVSSSNQLVKISRGEKFHFGGSQGTLLVLQSKLNFEVNLWEIMWLIKFESTCSTV